MDTDELEPRKAKPAPVDLETMSIEAIGDYIEGLQGEIERAKQAIARKQNAKSAADSFFRR